MTSRTDSNINRVKQLVRANRCQTVNMISEELSIGRDTVWNILTKNLKMHKLCAKVVPKILSKHHKQQRFTVCQDITEHLEAEPDLLNTIITGDETWVFKYDPETKRQCCEWQSYGSPRPVKAWKLKLKVTVMLIVLFDIQGIIHFEFLPQGQTVNQTIYKDIFWHLMKSVCDKRQSLWEVHAWMLHHDNAPAHQALSICQFLAERNIATLKYTPPFSNLALCDFFLFPKIKSVLKETQFFDVDSIKMAVMTELKKITENAFQQCIESWKRQMHKVLKWKGISLKEFDFGIFQCLSIKFL